MSTITTTSPMLFRPGTFLRPSGPRTAPASEAASDRERERDTREKRWIWTRFDGRTISMTHEVGIELARRTLVYTRPILEHAEWLVQKSERNIRRARRRRSLTVLTLKNGGTGVVRANRIPAPPEPPAIPVDVRHWLALGLEHQRDVESLASDQGGLAYHRAVFDLVPAVSKLVGALEHAAQPLVLRLDGQRVVGSRALSDLRTMLLQPFTMPLPPTQLDRDLAKLRSEVELHKLRCLQDELDAKLDTLRAAQRNALAAARSVKPAPLAPIKPAAAPALPPFVPEIRGPYGGSRIGSGRPGPR